MTRDKEQKLKEIRDLRHQELKRSAIQMFSQKGFATTKISDITDNANLSHGLFYHYFTSKDELYLEVIKDIQNDFIGLVEQATRLQTTPLGKLEWLTNATHSGSFREGVYRQLLVLQSLYSNQLNEAAKLELVALYKVAEDGIALIIEEGQKEGQFIDGDPNELAIYHLSLAHGLLLWNARAEKPLPLSADKVLRQLKRPSESGGRI